jgi:hypothetical protein
LAISSAISARRSLTGSSAANFGFGRFSRRAATAARDFSSSVVFGLQRLLLLAVQMPQIALHRGEAAGIGGENVALCAVCQSDLRALGLFVGGAFSLFPDRR